MNDDLVKRLREQDRYNNEYYVRDPLHKEAADRIEELEAALKYMAETKLIDDDYQEIARTALEGKTE